MVRPRKKRLIDFEPGFTYFKPRAVPLSELEEVKLTFGEFEAIRLKDLLDLKQVEAAKKLGVHQSTFQRTLTRARRKIADALVNGKAIRIQGGEYELRGRGFGGPRYCKCPVCGNKQPHVRGMPCVKTICEKCGSTMIRGDA